jgi:hypothetical protein
MNFQLVLLVLAPFSLAQSTATADTNPESITAQPLFASQKPCAQQCFFPDYFACPVDGVASAIGCQYGTNCPPSVETASYEAPNDCYCRLDLQPVASRYLSSCVLQKCTVGDSSIDMSSALGLYDTYCWAKGFVPATTTASAGNVGQGTFTTSLQGVQSITGTLPIDPSIDPLLMTGIATSEGLLGSSSTATGSSNTPGNGDSLSKPSEIATIVGTIVGVLSLIVGILTWRNCCK